MLIKFSSLLSMIEQEQGFYDLIKQNLNRHHSENWSRKSKFSLEDCSLITATYSVGRRSNWYIGDIRTN